MRLHHETPDSTTWNMVYDSSRVCEWMNVQ
jgi:hypothetical protein